MKAAKILAIVGEGAETLAHAVAERLHIPCAVIRAEDAASECIAITDYLTDHGKQFSVLAVGASACDYPPSALLLAARTTLCAMHGTNASFPDCTATPESTVEDVVAKWLSPEILSSFSG